MRVPEEQKWNAAMLQGVSATPFDEHQVREPEVVFRRQGQQEEVAKPQGVISRKVYIKAADLEAFGHTRGCARCEHELRYGPNRSGKPHSEICRSRIMAELAKTERGRLRIQAASDRLDRTLAEIGERALAQGERVQTDVPAPAPIQEIPKFETMEMPERMEMTPQQPEQSMEPMVPPDLGTGGNAEADMEEMTAPEPNEDIGDSGGMDIGTVAHQPTRPDGSIGSMLSSTDETAAPLADNMKTTEVGGGSKPNAGEQEFESDFKELLKVWTKDIKEDMKRQNAEILSLVKSLGGSTAKYRRERSRGIKAVVSEIYSPPRVTAATKLLPELKCLPGLALDLTTTDSEGRPWDFDDQETRERARRKVVEERPMLLIGSPMCRAWSA